MNKRTKVKLRKQLSRFGIVMGEKIPPLNHEQKKMISILRQVLNLPNSNPVVDPTDNTCQIESNECLLILSTTSIRFKSQYYDSYTQFDERIGIKLVCAFHQKVSEKRKKQISKYDVSSLSKLDKIYNDLKLVKNG